MDAIKVGDSWMPRREYELREEWLNKVREDYIQKCKNADWGLVAIIETMYESDKFNSYPKEQKQLVENFIAARMSVT